VKSNNYIKNCKIKLHPDYIHDSSFIYLAELGRASEIIHICSIYSNSVSNHAKHQVFDYLINSDNLRVIPGLLLTTTAILEALLKDRKVDISCNDFKVFDFCAEYGYAGCMRLLLLDSKAHAGPINRALQSAIKYGQCEMVKLLLKDERCDVSVSQHLAARLATRFGNHAILDLLLEYEYS
jgi:hypothetical protein